jgi:hypothetical protein
LLSHELRHLVGRDGVSAARCRGKGCANLRQLVVQRGKLIKRDVAAVVSVVQAAHLQGSTGRKQVAVMRR